MSSMFLVIKAPKIGYIPIKLSFGRKVYFFKSKKKNGNTFWKKNECHDMEGAHLYHKVRRKPLSLAENDPGYHWNIWPAPASDLQPLPSLRFSTETLIGSAPVVVYCLVWTFENSTSLWWSLKKEMEGSTSITEHFIIRAPLKTVQSIGSYIFGRSWPFLFIYF